MSTEQTGIDSDALDEFLTVPEIARLTKMGESTVYRLVEQGQVPGVVRLGEKGERIRVTRKGFLEWIAANLKTPVGASS